ncbi:MAG TPA: SPOR domain-containing protein [Gammaproteobacteria bacterium]|nr:SPOR domain-containing protein [Gammaproteobacteria bacterium]
MRTLLTVLLLLNILYFLWPKADQSPPPPLQRGQGEIPILVTLDEQYDMPAPGSIVPLEYDPEAYRAKTQMASAEGDAASSPSEPVAVEPTESAAETADDVKTAQDSGATLEDGPLASITQAITQRQEETKNKPAAVVAKAQPAKPVKACFTLGPFRMEEKTRKVIDDLTRLGAKATQRSAVERRTRGYWVYLPPYASREQASTEAQILTTRGLTDYFVVNDGQHDNAISLGLFTLKSGSERRIQQLKDLGYKPKVEVRFSEFPVYWVDIETRKKVDWSTFMQKNFPKGRIDRLKRSCS